MRRSQFPDEKILAIVKEGELSWFIDGSLVKSRAFRTEAEALMEAAEWRVRLEGKGWALASLRTRTS